MKKALFVITVALALMPVLAGCGAAGDFSLLIGEDNTAQITAVNADEDDFAAAGALVVDEGDMVVIEPAMEEDAEINIKLIPESDAGIEASAEELEEDISPENAVLDVNINGTGTTEAGMPAGEYLIHATVVKAGSGTIAIRVETPDEQEEESQ